MYYCGITCLVLTIVQGGTSSCKLWSTHNKTDNKTTNTRYLSPFITCIFTAVSSNFTLNAFIKCFSSSPVCYCWIFLSKLFTLLVHLLSFQLVSHNSSILCPQHPNNHKYNLALQCCSLQLCHVQTRHARR